MSGKNNIKKDKLKAVIIGAGRIASGFDNPDSQEILTHAHAYRQHKAIMLEGFFDTDENAAKRAARKWSSNYFRSLEEIFIKVAPDIVSVCTPDADHFVTIKKILPYKPALIICEKPVTVSHKDTQALVALCRKNKINILVNFSRRFDAVVQDLKNSIEKNKLGKVISASGVYTKGIKHNGSHLIDLARYLFGEVKKIQPLYSINDYQANDRTVAGFLQFRRCPQFHLLASDQRAYSIFELDILFTKGRVRLIDSGFKMITQSVRPDNLYKGFFGLSDGLVQETGLKYALFNMVDMAVRNVLVGEPLICDIADALKTQKIVEKLTRN